MYVMNEDIAHALVIKEAFGIGSQVCPKYATVCYSRKRGLYEVSDALKGKTWQFKVDHMSKFQLAILSNTIDHHALNYFR